MIEEDNVPYRPGMTLMPGQSTTVSIPIPEGIVASMGGVFQFEEVPPPAKAPVQDIAETLGVCAGLRAEKSRYGQWRCACCSKMQKENSWQIWVPDGVRRGDPDWSVTEAARRNAYNGHASAWCLACAPKGPKQYRQNTTAAAGVPLQPAPEINYFPLAFAVAVGALGLMAIMAMLPR